MIATMPRPSRLGAVKDEIVALRREGWTLQAIGDLYGCSREAIRLVCDANGATAPPKCPREHYRRLAHAVAVAARHELRRQRGGTLSMHGTVNRYNHGCSCDECRAGMRAYVKSLAERKPPRHGTPSAYFNYRCRCDRCKAAGSAYNRISRIRARAKRDLLSSSQESSNT